MILHRLMLVADQQGTGGRPLPDVVVRAANGVGGRLVVQFREREMQDRELIAVIRAVQRRMPPHTTLIVNDRPALARELDIGLHLPTRSAKPDGRYALLGRSVHDQRESRQALDDNVDYAVVGTIFETASHPGRAGAGLAHLSEMRALLGDTPCYAIGGINAERVPRAVDVGAWGVAVRTAILAADDPAEAAYRLHGSLPA
ncbi:MAG: thiamine phosphate synthase [Chloroflexi bacterium]|nr:thiamine phosphate synthase [Chloroflexota bacterium]MYF21861.1 thiamine phosphate synthase [Chloroflexota bacterium]